MYANALPICFYLGTTLATCITLFNIYRIFINYRLHCAQVIRADYTEVHIGTVLALCFELEARSLKAHFEISFFNWIFCSPNKFSYSTSLLLLVTVRNWLQLIRIRRLWWPGIWNIKHIRLLILQLVLLSNFGLLQLFFYCLHGLWYYHSLSLSTSLKII